LIRNFGNKLGLAWWAKIETNQPKVPTGSAHSLQNVV